MNHVMNNHTFFFLTLIRKVQGNKERWQGVEQGSLWRVSFGLSLREGRISLGRVR